MVGNSAGDLFLGTTYTKGFAIYSSDGNGTTIDNLGFGEREVLLIKYNKDGVLQWITGSSKTDGAKTRVYEMALDESNRVYLTGNFSDPMTFESTSSNNVDLVGGGFYLACYDENGNALWGNNTYDWPVSDGWAVGAGHGKVVATGFYNNVLSSNFKHTNFTSSDGNNQYFDLLPSFGRYYVAYDTSGILQWVTGPNGTNLNSLPVIGSAYDVTQSIEIDTKGGFYAGGAVESFGGATAILLAGDTLPILGSADGGFLAYYSPDICGFKALSNTIDDTGAKGASVGAVIYPNPFTDHITIELEEAMSQDAAVQVFNVLGEKVATYKLKSGLLSYEIDTHNLTSGVYFIHQRFGEHNRKLGLVIKN